MRIVIFVAVALTCAPAYSQSQIIEVGAAGAVSIQPEGTPDGHYLNGALGGAAPAIVVSGGVRSGRFIARGELSTGSSVGAGDQQELVPGGHLTWKAQHRDTILSGLVGYHALAKAAQLEILGGLSWVSGRTDRTEVGYEPFIPPFAAQQRPDETINNQWLALSGGIDLALPMTAKVAIVPTARVHYVVQREPADQPPQLGIGSWIMRLGAGLRVAF